MTKPNDYDWIKKNQNSFSLVFHKVALIMVNKEWSRQQDLTVNIINDLWKISEKFFLKKKQKNFKKNYYIFKSSFFPQLIQKVGGRFLIRLLWIAGTLQ